MDAFVDTLVQLLIDWGYVGLFISALLAGSIIPFSSEIVMVALVKVGLSPALCVLSATLGNTLGGMTCYYMGRLGRIDWIEKYFKVKREKIERMQHLNPRWVFSGIPVEVSCLPRHCVLIPISTRRLFRQREIMTIIFITNGGERLITGFGRLNLSRRKP